MLIPCQLPNKPRYWTQTDADCGALPGFISRIRNKLYIHEFNLMVLLSMSTARRSMLEVSTWNRIKCKLYCKLKSPNSMSIIELKANASDRT